MRQAPTNLRLLGSAWIHGCGLCAHQCGASDDFAAVSLP
jgi:hypothetical protein